jgi:hypothetical protein
MLMMRCRSYFINFLATMFLGTTFSAFGATVTDDEVKQKLEYAATFISSSAASKRIAASDHVEARAKLLAAQERLSAAQSAFASGNLDDASARSDEAMNLMSQAARLVPSESVQQLARARHEKLVKGIETLEAAYQAALSEPGTLDPSGLDSSRIHKMMDDAKALAEAGKYDESNRILADAMDEISGALSKLHGSKTISYELIFASPAEEYAYELERYRSLEDAIPLAIEQMQPSQADIDNAEAYINKAKQRRQQADADAKQGYYEAALLQIRDGSLQMETALNALGVTY